MVRKVAVSLPSKKEKIRLNLLRKSITLPFGNLGGGTKNKGGSLLLYAIELVGLEFKQVYSKIFELFYSPQF